MKFLYIHRVLAVVIAFIGFYGNGQTVPCSVNINSVITPGGDCNGVTATLTASGQGAFTYVMNNNFDGGNAGPGWSSNITASFNNPCDPSVDGGTYMWMGNSAPHPRIIQTVPLDLSCGGTMCFYLDFATQGNPSPCEGIDLANEGVYLEYSIDGGATWITIEYYGPAGVGNNTNAGGNNPQMTSWNQYCMPIPPGAQTANTIIHWAQTGSSGNANDHWGLDNVTITSNGGCAPYWYDWSNVAGPNNPPGQVVTATTTTTYTVTYTNGTDICTANVTVVVPPGPTADAGPDQVICGGSGPVTIGGNPVCPDNGATYSWSNGAGSGTINLGGGVNGQVTVNPAVTTTYTLTVTYNGCTSTDQVTVTVDAPPTASNPAPINVACAADVPAPDVLVVTDEADDVTVPPTVTYVGQVSNGGSCPEIITRTYRVTDACGNFVDVYQTITINDLIPPTASNPATVSVTSLPPPNVNVVIDELDNCGVPTVTFIGDATDGNFCPETVTRTYRVTDQCGNYIDVTQTIIIGDGALPTASNPPPINVQCIADVPAPNPLVVTDEADNSGVPTVTWEDDVSDGNSCPEVITRRYRVTDNCNTYIFVSQTITVWDNIAPVLSSMPANLTVQCPGDVPPMQAITWTDNCDGSGLLPGNETPLSGGNCGGTIVRTWSYTDACGNTVSHTQTITVDDTTPPTASNPATTYLPGGSAVPPPNVNLVIDEADNCTVNPTVTLLSSSSNNGNCPEIITRVYQVADACGNTTNVTHLIEIGDNIPPTADPIPAISVNCIANVPAPNPLVVTNEADNGGVPTVAWISDVSDNGNCPEVITRTYRVTDNCNNYIDLTQTITINVTAGPVVPANTTSTVQCLSAATQPAAPAVVDQCGNPLTPVITSNADPACNGNKVYTFTYTDCAGNSSVYTHTYTINLTTAPVVPANGTSTIECISAAIQPVAPIVSDACGNNLVPVITANADPVCEGNKVYTYTYTDCAGNVSVYTYTYVIDVTSSPVVPANDAENVVCVADVYVPTAPVVTDVCGNTLVPVMTENADPVCIGNKVYTFTYTDCAGNSSVYTYTFSINDNVNPTASNPAPITVMGAAYVPAPNPAVVTDEADNCTANPVVAWVSDVSDGNVCNGEVITRTYSVTDDCGNVTHVEQFITISATYPPIDAGPAVIVCEGNTIALTAINPMNVPISWDNGVIDGMPFSPTTTTTYTVTANNLGCISTDNVIVTVEPLPQPSFYADVLSGCAPIDITFTNTSTGGSAFSSCVWQIEGGTPIDNCGTIVYTFDQAGTYDVTLTTTTVNGCSNTVTYSDYIYIEAYPNAAFSASSNVLSNLMTTVNFANNSTGAVTYVWDFGDESGNSTLVNPSHHFPDEGSGSYIVQLIASTMLGCRDTAYLTIEVNEELIYYVPNSFTPDDDDHNATFQPIFSSGYDPYDYTMYIFNRWGEIVFESHDVNVGWNGTYGGRVELAQDGVYIWKLEFKTTMSDERVTVQGHVNLLR